MNFTCSDLGLEQREGNLYLNFQMEFFLGECQKEVPDHIVCPEKQNQNNIIAYKILEFMTEFPYTEGPRLTLILGLGKNRVI